MPKIRVALVLGCAIALAGCYDIEQEIVLNRDLSGTASLRMRVDKEPMVYYIAMKSKQSAGGSACAIANWPGRIRPRPIPRLRAGPRRYRLADVRSPESVNQFDFAEFSRVSHKLRRGTTWITGSSLVMTNYMRYIHFSSCPGLTRASTSASRAECEPA